MNVLRGLFFLVAALIASGVVNAVELGTRTNSEGGVTVSVKAKNVAPGAAVWEFDVALNTHSQDLSDDLVKNSVLIDAKGARHEPLAWEGAPPGGHHRSGVLRFKGLVKLPGAVELQIRRPGEPAPRSFRWDLK
ncbi:MAG: hypothetical protein OEO84_15290 [Betaproteobacteria bacterium]|nr:hypothetical protein [Betaproteobacteria bacterium]MDH5536458.1 hypothetical protein [Betaproteobacteria bacterium]